MKGRLLNSLRHTGIVRESDSKKDQRHEILAALVLKVKAGDPQAFDRLFQETVERTVRLVRSLTRQHHLIDDLIQEIYLIVWQKLSWLNDPKSFQCWLNRVTVHRTYRLMEQDRKKSSAASFEETQREPESPPDADPGERLPLLLDLQSAFTKISKEEQALLVLREVHSFSYEELAETLAVPLGTVRSRLHFTRKKLLRHFRSHVEQKKVQP